MTNHLGTCFSYAQALPPFSQASPFKTLRLPLDGKTVIVMYAHHLPRLLAS